MLGFNLMRICQMIPKLSYNWVWVIIYAKTWCYRSQVCLNDRPEMAPEMPCPPIPELSPQREVFLPQVLRQKGRGQIICYCVDCRFHGDPLPAQNKSSGFDTLRNVLHKWAIRFLHLFVSLNLFVIGLNYGMVTNGWYIVILTTVNNQLAEYILQDISALLEY